MILAVLLSVLGVVLADLGDINPPWGTCFCMTSNNVNIRSSAGLSAPVIGSANSGQCFKYTALRLTTDGYIWFRIDFNGQDGWAAGSFMEVGSESQCAGGSCSGNGGPFDQLCLDCICEIESGCRPLECEWDVNSLSCGYFQIKEAYYTDCYRPGNGWESCSKDLSCATTCVKNYMNRYYGYCTGSSSPQCCEQAARIHNGGPSGCDWSATLDYWRKVQACVGRSRQEALEEARSQN